jgi:4'-phosphopantetheinyl transferase
LTSRPVHRTSDTAARREPVRVGAAAVIEVWWAPLDVDPKALAAFEASLSRAEHARASALRGAQLRRRYVADHGWRRRLLGERLGCAPAEVAYTIGARGKPELPPGAPHFSASRSADIALYAVSESAEVGVDVEEVRDDVDLAAMARRFFSPAERAVLERIPARERAAAGFACWTRKEAYAKALGSGLVFPLDAIEVWMGDARPVRHGEVAVHRVDVGPGIEAAVAVRAENATEVSIPNKARVIN